MRICIDVDGTICKTRVAGESYSDVAPMPEAIESLKALRREGHYLILYSARHMKTCQANVGQVIAREGKNLLLWLERHGIEYDEIHFGKPFADIYIDDNVLVYKNNWPELVDQIRDRKEST